MMLLYLYMFHNLIMNPCIYVCMHVSLIKETGNFAVRLQELEKEKEDLEVAYQYRLNGEVSRLEGGN